MDWQHRGEGIVGSTLATRKMGTIKSVLEKICRHRGLDVQRKQLKTAWHTWGLFTPSLDTLTPGLYIQLPP